ncbi:helix-turn-helix transcriptional regulator [Deinococcus hopiensis]|uniref:Predicted DNA-binding transcriptional regulator YafY, contains an HTH and WYL domains n=1 Tax=Deinococcus hopiensis KR-140 TaxID=695939 RepID=A0A1W1V4U5_9DEIO|nr:YafY family protein [Deinococcus hopiensis]SMB88378.1 Predicted DNA-binding transcriptional regulator YafY, contains an HTH and WYL domains [Deinococcus hopiensis KR-140]
MNRTDRLLALVLELRGRGWVRAEDLARTFEISVRTVYRDVLALSEAGVPVISVPGQGYRLMEGYFLPPLHFTPQEAVMLTLGADAVARAFDVEYAGAAAQAAKKLLAALPDERRADVERVREHLRVVPPGSGRKAETLRLLRGAVLDNRIVTFVYRKPGGGPDARQVYPLGLVHLYGVWLLVAFDPAQAAQRHFRLDRMEDARALPQTFTRDPEWRVEYRPEREERNVTVRLRFPAERARTVRERPHLFQTEEAHTPHGYEVTLRVRDTRAVLSWVLSWGGDAEVLEPEDLREQVWAEARRMLSRA